MMDEKMPAAGHLRYARTYAPFTHCRTIAIAIGREIDWIMREARPARDGREAKKRRRHRGRGIYVAVACWANGERDAAAVAGCASDFFAAGVAVAAITSGSSRNRGEHRP